MNNILSRLLTTLTVLLTTTAAHAEWERYALVIGYNQSDDAKLAPLKYADDDAVKYAELFGYVTEKTILLADVDAESARVFGPRKVDRPTRGNVLKALKTLRGQMSKARESGKKPVLYFVFSGHGNYDQEGRGYVHLADGRWTTRDLYYSVFGPTRGKNPHHVVMVADACNAALLVNSRGSDRRRVRGTSLKLESYPNVGVILSSSTIGEVHEWGRYLSGIFSHEVRSALLGAGDLNDDGDISFPELAAFVAAANSAVKNETYRVKPYIRPPLSAPNLPLISLNNSRFPARVRVSKDFAGKAHLVNNELLRYADFHKGAGQGFWLALPGTEGFSLVYGDNEFVVPSGARGDLQLSKLTVRKRSVVASRGPSAYFEERLFAQPYKRGDAQRWLNEEYVQTLQVTRFESVPWYHNAGAWTLLGSSMAVLGAGVGFHMSAFDAQADAKQAIWADEIDRANARVSRNETIAATLYGVSSLATVGSVLWFALDKRYKTHQYQPPFRISMTPLGVQLRTEF